MENQWKISIPNDNMTFHEDWILEKLSYAMHDLVKVLQKESLHENADLISAMRYLLNIFSCFNGKLFRINCEEMLPIIQQYGVDGYDFIVDLFNDTHKGKFAKSIVETENDNKSLSKIYQLIRENIPSNRTLINEELYKILRRDSFTLQFEEDLEHINQGEKQWDWFYSRYKDEQYQVAHKVGDELVALYMTFKQRTGKLEIITGI